MSVDEALAFFKKHNETKIVKKIQSLADVGMGYVALGQSSSTLSGGEAQRIKLASYLTKGSHKDCILFLFDEPTTGLHFHDIGKLLKSFRQLIDKGHSIIVIEHNTSLIEHVEHIIEDRARRRHATNADGWRSGSDIGKTGRDELRWP